MDLQDVYNIEGEAETEEDYSLSLQTAINSGMAWKLQGQYGRAAMDALESGSCMLPDEDHFDYYGNMVPARSRLEPGSKGTRENVVNARGEDWAKMLEEV